LRCLRAVHHKGLPQRIAMRTMGRKIALEGFQQMPRHTGIRTFRPPLRDDAAPLGYELLALRNLLLGPRQVRKSNATQLR
jgi:hypothetical protein